MSGHAAGEPARGLPGGAMGSWFVGAGFDSFIVAKYTPAVHT